VRRLEERAAVAVESRVHAVEDGDRADGDHVREDEQNRNHSAASFSRSNARNRPLIPRAGPDTDELLDRFARGLLLDRDDLDVDPVLRLNLRSGVALGLGLDDLGGHGSNPYG
jgi:hypothetical protein